MNTPAPDLHDIQGDVLVGLQKNAELFLFFRIADTARFKSAVRQYVVGQLTSAYRVRERERLVAERRLRREPAGESWLGLNLGFTNDGMAQLLGPRRPAMDPGFERGADHPKTIAFRLGAAMRLGIDAELLAARMLGRWRSGALLELASLTDNARLAADLQRNNDFSYAGDPFQRTCPIDLIHAAAPSTAGARRQSGRARRSAPLFMRDCDPPHS